MSVETLIGLDERLGHLRWRVRLLATLGAVGAMTLLRWVFRDWLELLPFLPYFPVVVVCAALFGPRYGYLASVLAFPVAMFLFVAPEMSLTFNLRAWLAGVLFLMVLLFVAWTVGTLRHVAVRLHRAEQARRILVAEMNHRIKNNLQMVSSLLVLESARFTDSGIKQVLAEAIGRVGVIGQLHTLLLHGDGEAEQVQANEFLRRLCEDLRTTFIGPRRIALEMRVQPVVLAADRAIPLGLVVNEAVTNALRHGFPPGCVGAVWVELTAEGGRAVLTVTDDGAGIDDTRPKGLGSQIIDMMAHQLAGTLVVSDRAGGGTVIRLAFPLEAPYPSSASRKISP